MSALEGFWRDYADVARRLEQLHAMPKQGRVLPLTSNRR